MKHPGPESSSIITQQFEDLTGTLLPVDQVELLKESGDPLFTEEEANAACDQLVHVFRQLCVKERITVDYFNEKYKSYAIKVLGKTPTSAANNRANIIKMLKKGDSISWKKFLELTHLVLGLHPESISIQFSNVKTSEPVIISTSAELMQ